MLNKCLLMKPFYQTSDVTLKVASMNRTWLTFKAASQVSQNGFMSIIVNIITISTRMLSNLRSNKPSTRHIQNTIEVNTKFIELLQLT